MKTPYIRRVARPIFPRLLLALAVSSAALARADDLSELRQELEASRAAIERLEQRIRQLESAQAAPAGLSSETVPPAGAATAVVAAPAPTSSPAARSAADAKLDIYGFIQLDTIYDVNQSDPDWKDTLRVSKIPINCPDDAGCGKDGETVFGVRQTRIGIRGKTPTAIGDLNTKLEFELFGVGVDAGQTTPRLRHAWAELGDFGAGQTWSLFMDPDVFPNTIDYWGPTGMMFLRNPQLRWTAYRGKGSQFAIALESPSSALDTGKIQDIDPEDNPLSIQSENNLPDLTAQWRASGDWGHAQLAGILRSVGYETENTRNGEPSGDELGWGLNASTSIAFGTRDKLHLQLAYGEGIASYINDGGNDLAPNDDLDGAEVLPLLGALLYYDHYWNENWSSSIGWSIAEQDTSDGQFGSAYEGARYGNLNLLYYPVPGIMVGGELVYGELELKDGSEADDTRLQMSFKYNFD
ncbi:MAG: porin [Gammaproteobacteria bacterium]|nr:porin [Gammaproteobacteria bacterium]MBK9468509.1 porin [Gammaproteobacteria bacterium]MBP6479215.1 porin [Pseudomonadales bacterium]MBP7909215.1 porin [Pseudomonadales bacterium]